MAAKKAPRTVQILIDTDDDNFLYVFASKRIRTDWLKENYVSYPVNRYVFATYQRVDK